ncbi:hypothetical protein [Oscillibacter sp. 1-3]|uniref:hypothetical protein n=1 Tax=Oscillibacter sp. 1-3 TaxID=1235797 RepID=UPI00039B9092|nr:hypothetical protein [Oscillibacter sp. 1-3]MCI9511764.1 hypothetical protein [Oscillibacter sp.]
MNNGKTPSWRISFRQDGAAFLKSFRIPAPNRHSADFQKLYQSPLLSFDYNTRPQPPQGGDFPTSCLFTEEEKCGIIIAANKIGRPPGAAALLKEAEP